MSSESERSCVRGGEVFLSVVKARSTPTPALSGRRCSSASAPASNSIAVKFSARSTIVRSFSAGHSHRNVVFFSTRRGYTVDAGWMREDFCFVEQSGRSYVRNHKAGFHAGTPGKERGQTFVHIGI